MDLNADMGESFGRWTLGDDEALLEHVTSANVACGFHAGDPLTMRQTVQRAAERGVAVGAHPSYRDLAGFGRRFIDVAPAELTADIIVQLGALQAMCAANATEIRYVKPHGALYNRAAVDEVHARAIVDAIRDVNPAWPVLTLPGSVLAREAEQAGLRAVGEAFADRNYRPDGTLVPRSHHDALVRNGVAERVVEMVTTGRVPAADGTPVAIAAESVCLHGDTPGAVQLAAEVRAALDAAGVRLEPFA